MEALDLFMFLVLLAFSTTVSGENTTTVPDHTTIIPQQFETLKNVSDKEKMALRYGFHRTHECNSFEQSFICIRKCLDKNFDVAYADKHCICTCFKNRDKAKYKSGHAVPPRWHLGAPTTRPPPWPQPVETKLVAVVSDFSSEMKSDGDSVVGKHTSSENGSNNVDHLNQTVVEEDRTNYTMNGSNESEVTEKNSNNESNASEGTVKDLRNSNKTSGGTPEDHANENKPDSNQSN